MFERCTSLEDLSPWVNWDVSNVKYMEGIFNGCSGLVDLSCLNEWGVSNMENMKDIFKNCNSIEKYPEWFKE